MITLRLEGGPQLAKALGALTLSQERAKLRKALTAAGEPMRAAMEAKAPVEPGAPDIKDHIVISAASRVDGRKVEDTETAVAVGPEKSFFYGMFLEYGFLHEGRPPRPVSPQPFMRPAFDTTQDETLRVLQEGIWKILRDLSSRTSTGSSGGTL